MCGATYEARGHKTVNIFNIGALADDFKSFFIPARNGNLLRVGRLLIYSLSAAERRSIRLSGTNHINAIATYNEMASHG